MAKQPKFLVDFGRTTEGQDLFNHLDLYRKSKGWSWIYLFLMGSADVIGKQADAPDIIVKIADYIER